MSEVLKRRQRCAVYCRVSSDERLDQSFNSIDAQKEAGHAYVASQRSEGWIPVADDYDDLEVTPSMRNSFMSLVVEPSSTKRVKMCRMILASRSLGTRRRSFTS